MSFPKMKLKVIRYRNYKTFNNDAFVNSLRKELISQKKVLDFRFSEHCTKVLDKRRPGRFLNVICTLNLRHLSTG